MALAAKSGMAIRSESDENCVIGKFRSTKAPYTLKVCTEFRQWIRYLEKLLVKVQGADRDLQSKVCLVELLSDCVERHLQAKTFSHQTSATEIMVVRIL